MSMIAEVVRAGGPVMFYDGTCALCDRAVRTVLVLDRRARIRIAPLQGTWGDALRLEYPDAAIQDSIIVVDSGGAYVRSDAIVQLVTALGFPWQLVGVVRLIPRRLRDAVYDRIARNRYRLWPRGTSCPTPSPAMRARLLGD